MGGFLGNVTAGQIFATPISPTPVQPTTAAPDQIGTQQNKVVATDAGNANGENQAVAKSAVTQHNQLPGFQQLGLPANGTTSAAATTGVLTPPAAFVAAVTTTAPTTLSSKIGEQVAQAAPADSVNPSGMTTALAAKIGEQAASSIPATDATTQLTTQVKKILPDAIGENATSGALADQSSTNAGPLQPPIR